MTSSSVSAPSEHGPVEHGLQELFALLRVAGRYAELMGDADSARTLTGVRGGLRHRVIELAVGSLPSSPHRRPADLAPALSSLLDRLEQDIRAGRTVRAGLGFEARGLVADMRAGGYADVESPVTRVSEGFAQRRSSAPALPAAQRVAASAGGAVRGRTACA